MACPGASSPLGVTKWLAARGEPVGREIEMVECLRGRRVGALEHEREWRDSCPRHVDGGRDRGHDYAERDEKREPFAPAAAPRARPHVPAFWDVGCDGGDPLGDVWRRL